MRRVLAISLAAAACAGCTDPNTTAATPIVLGLDIGGTAASAVDVQGRAITFTSASLCVSGVETFAGEAVLAARADSRDWVFAVRDALSFASAHAHPGHYEAGGTMGEVQGPVVVDLLAAAPAALTGEGISGHHGSASLTLCDDDTLGGTARLAGSVVLDDGSTRAFAFSAAAPDVIEGIPVDVDTSGDLTLQLQVQLAQVAARADFSVEALAASTDEVFIAASGSQIDNAFARALQASSTYVFSAR
jgi:hypothetical protein